MAYNPNNPNGQATMANSAPVVLASNQSNLPTNVAQINAVTPLMGNGVTGTGSQRVTIASDNTAFSVNAAMTQVDTNITGTISATDILAAAPGGAGVLISTAPTANSFVAGLVPGGTAQADIQITGTATGTYYFEGSMDSTTGSDGNWIAVNYRQTGITNTVLGYSATAVGVYRGAPSGFKYIRVRNVGGTTPSNPVIIRYSNGSGTTFLNASIPAGTNTIGSLAANQSTNVAQVAGTTTDTNSGNKSAGTLRVVLATDQPALTNKLLVTPDSVALPANQSVNVSQINGVTALMGNGVTGTGSQRVTIASDNTAFSVNATLSAETTKVIGVIRTADGAGNLLTSNSTTYTAKFGLDGNLLGTLGTAFSTAGKVDVKGADGDVFVRQATASNLNATVSIAAAQTLATVTTVSTVTNLAQMNGVALLMGNGASGTGAQRVSISSDNTAIAGWGQGATGAAVPSGATYGGVLAKTALPTAATDGNLTGTMSDKFGRPVVNLGTVRDLRATQTTTISASTAETTIVTAGGAGVFNDIIGFVISNTSAATNTRIDFRDATAGTIIFSLQVPGNQVVGFGLPGTSIPQTTAANNWTATCATSTTDIRIFAIYEKNK